MALRSGFYNAMMVEGDYDRKYNAEDYSNIFAAFIKDGVRRSGLNDFKVTASGLSLSIKNGFAVCGGRWVHLDSDYSLTVANPPVGDYSRIDAVVLRVNTNDATRAASIIYRTGTAASSPVAPAKSTGAGISELIIAHVRVAPSATSVTITDTRPNAALCGWVTTPVGYDDYFESLDDANAEHLKEIDNEWRGMKDNWASTTIFKPYQWRTVLTASANYVVFNIPQYDPTGVDVLQVYVNGLLEAHGVDYTVSGSTITFTNANGSTGTKTAGTEIVVIVWKSIDGAGLGSVLDAVTDLQNDVNVLSAANEYVYICNGTDDNVKLSQIASAWLSGGTDYGSKIIRVYGTFGAKAANSGSGTTSSLYRWFDIGAGSATNRKITFDFSGCSEISISCASGTHNIIFFGMNVNIIGANVTASGGAAINMFSTAASTVVNAEDCRFWITSQAGLIARGGTFKNCRASLTTSSENAFCFNVLAGGLLRVFGGEYYAYAPSSGISAVVYVNSAQTGAVAVTYGMNCPTSARSGYVQSYAVNCLTDDACCSFTDTITLLTMEAAGQNIRGTIKINKAGLL